jgi:hypothetical protein
MSSADADSRGVHGTEHASIRSDSGEPMNRPIRRSGWLLVALGVGALMSLAVYLVLTSLPVDPRDGGWADVAFVISPFLTLGCAIVTGALLVIVSIVGLVEVPARLAVRSVFVGSIAAPVLYFVALLALAGFLDAAATDGIAILLPTVAFMLPVVVGAGVVIATPLLAMRQSKRSSDRDSTAGT